MLKWTNTLETSKSLSPKKGSVIVMKGKVKKSSPKRENETPSKPSLKSTAAPIAGKPASLPTNQGSADSTQPNRYQTLGSKTEPTVVSNKGQIAAVIDPVTDTRGNFNGGATSLPKLSPGNHSYQQVQDVSTGNPQISLPDEGVARTIPQTQSPHHDFDSYNRSPQHLANPSPSFQGPSPSHHSKMALQTLASDIYPPQKDRAPSPQNPQQGFQSYPSSLPSPRSHASPPSPKPTNLNTTSHYSAQVSPVQKPSGSPRQNIPYPQSDQYFQPENISHPNIQIENRNRFNQEEYDEDMFDDDYQPDPYYDNSTQQSHGYRHPSFTDQPPIHHGQQSPHFNPNYSSPGSRRDSGSYPPNINDRSPYTSSGSHRSRSRERKGSSPNRGVNKEQGGYVRNMSPVVDQQNPQDYYNTPMQGQQYPYDYTEEFPMSQPPVGVTNSPAGHGPGSPQYQIPPPASRHNQQTPSRNTQDVHGPANAQYTANKHHRAPSPQMGVQHSSPHQQKINANQNMMGHNQRSPNFNDQMAPKGQGHYSPTRELCSPDNFNSYPIENSNNQFDSYPSNASPNGRHPFQSPHNNPPYEQEGYMTMCSDEYSNEDQRHNLRRNSYSSSSPRKFGPQGLYNPANVDTSFQVKTPLKHIENNTPTKIAPKSPKTPLALPLGAKQPPSPSTVARALKVNPMDETNVKGISAENQKHPSTIKAKPMLPPIPKKEIFITFPDKQMIKQFVDPNMAMMDLLIQLAASKRLNPSAYVLVAISETDNKPIDYKANQPVGLVETHRVSLLPKEQVKSTPTAAGAGNDNNMDKPLPFEMTYRLTINLPHGQKVVRRMSCNHPLHELHQSVCEEKNLDPNLFVLQRPDKPGSMINLKYTLQELGLQQYELNLVNTASVDHYMSVPNLSETSWIANQPNQPNQPNQSQGPSKNYIYMPPPGESRKKKGFFSFLRKDKKGKSSGDLLNNRNTGKQRPASMFSPVTESLENYMKKPKKSSKKKPAPPPPTSTSPAGGFAKPNQGQTSSTLPRPVSYPQGESPRNTGTTVGPGNQPTFIHMRPSSELSGSVELPSASHPPSDAHRFNPPLPIPPHMRQPHHHSPRTPPHQSPRIPPHQSPVIKIGTDSITYVESNNSNGHGVTISMNPLEVHAVPHSKNGVVVDHSPPNKQQKTANDMYASPLKKRKPAPPPPPGGPQVIPSLSARQRNLISSSTNSSQSHNPYDTSYSSSASSLDPQSPSNEHCNTPLITIKTGSSSKDPTMPSDLKFSFNDDEKNLEGIDLPDFDDDSPAPDACSTLVNGTDDVMHSTDAFTIDATDLSDSLEELSKVQRPCSFIAPPPPLTPPPSGPPSNIPSPITVMEEYDRVDKNVGITEDSASLAATGVPLPINVVAEELNPEMELYVEHSSNITVEEAKDLRPVTPMKVPRSSDGSQSPGPRLPTGNQLTEGTAIYLAKHRNSIASATDDDFSTTDTVTSNVSMGETLSPKSLRNGNHHRQSISSEGSFTTLGMSDDYNMNGVHEMSDQLPNGDALSEEKRMIPEIVETVEIGAPYGMEQVLPNRNHVVEDWVGNNEVNGIEDEIVVSVNLDNASRPALESCPSLELSRSSSAAELVQYMNSPKEELVLTKEDRKSLDYRGSPMIENQKRQEAKEENKNRLSPSNEKRRSPKIKLDGYTLSIDSEADTLDSESTQGDSIPLSAQTNLKKQIERWQKQLQEHLNDNSGLYTEQEQEKLREKVDQWNKQLRELNVTDSSGFRVLEQKVMKQQIELWQRKLSAKERQSDGAKKYKEQEIEFLKKQVHVWKQKINVIQKSSNLYTIEESEVLQEQIDLWQNQLDKKGCDTDSSTNEQNLLRRQIEVWKKNLKDKKFAGHSFSAQEQDILRRQLIVWQKQLQWYKAGDPSSKREILKEQMNVWHSQLQDVQNQQDKDSKLEQEILEQQIELWENKMNEKNSDNEDVVMKQIDIWKKQTKDSQNIDNDFLVVEQKLLQREIQLWNKKLNADDVECEAFLAEEMDVLCDKINLYQQRLQKNDETNSTMEPIEQDLLKLQVDLWQQKLAAVRERKDSLQKYNEEQQNILQFQIELWQGRLANQNIDISGKETEMKGSELLAKEIDIWQRWLNVKREKKETRIKFKLLDEELQKDQIRLWQDHLDIIKYNTLGYTEEEREILMQQIELWQRGLIENKDKKIIHLAAEQDILKKYIDLWYTKMKRNTDTSIGEEESDVREQISIWKKQLKLFTFEETPLSHSVQQDILNQQIMVWQKKREKCHSKKDNDELGKIESEILQQQIELWQNDLLDYEKSRNQKENVPQKQIKLLERKLSKTDKDVNPEITAQENAIVNRQIDFYKKMSSFDEGYNADYITDEQEILEKQINLARLKLSQTDSNTYYSETEHDLLQKQVNLWHRQLIAIQHRLDIRKKIAAQEQNLLKEQISLWETKLTSHLGSSYHVEEQKAMKDQLEIWQQQLEEHKTTILNKGSSSNIKEDPLVGKMAQMLKSQEEIIQSFEEGLKHLPENLKTQVRSSSPSSPQTKIHLPKNVSTVLPPPPELPQKPITPKEIKPQIKNITNFPPPPETFSDKLQKQKENSKTKDSSSPVPALPPKPSSPPPKLPFTVNLKKVGPPKENSPPVKTEVNFFRKQNDTEGGIVRAVPAMVVLKPPSVAPKPKRKLPEPELAPREKLLLEIKNSSRSNLKGVRLKDTKWSGNTQS